MAGASIKYDFKGIENFSKKFENLDTESKKKLNDKIAGVLEGNVISRFQKQVDPEGNKWASNLRGGQILTLRGFLQKSITSQADENIAEVGTNVKYGAIHQYGGTIKARLKNFLCFNVNQSWVKKKSVTIPARPYLGLSAQDESDIAEQIQVFINGALS